jgi:hypothetical protein
LRIQRLPPTLARWSTSIQPPMHSRARARDCSSFSCDGARRPKFNPGQIPDRIGSFPVPSREFPDPRRREFRCGNPANAGDLPAKRTPMTGFFGGFPCIFPADRESTGDPC